MELFAVTGKPVFQSMSPQMHNAAFNELSMDSHYVRIAADSGEESVETAAMLGAAGMNITAPFKECFFRLAGKKDKFAEKTGSVNCAMLSGRNGRGISGFNTDVFGVAEALRNNGADISGQNACVIGAGGAARSAVIALLGKGANVTVLNRTVEKAREISGSFGCDYGTLSPGDLEKSIPGAGIIISAVTGTGEIIPEKLLPENATVLDANYSSKSTLTDYAEKKGCRLIDGREWLLFQGAKSFEIFTGKKAPLGAMRSALYSGQSGQGKQKNGKKNKTNISLIGFMGTGKSSVALEISRASGMRAIDTDAGIEKNSGGKVADLFARFGEAHFRGIESAEILKLESAENSAIACGGGAVIDPKNAESLRRHSNIVLLASSVGRILEMVGNDSTRPLLGRENREDSVRKLLSERIGHYACAADLVVSGEKRNPKEIAEVILREIR
ncbi:Shikimate dehydrogenase (NADP(+)) [uncultured archaeon]|nr:Shikimate dehydrogenase (NADP(+)) [uncultured archaeon]